nr:uncharacterized protein LOC104086300 isoform X1 [Nicotiana tomentosiformis]
MNQEAHSSKNKKVKNCIAAGSLAYLRNQKVSPLKTKRIVQGSRSNDKHQLNLVDKQLPQLGAQVQEQLLQLPMRSTSPPTQTVYEEAQQLPPHSTSLASQAVRENLQQLQMDSTTRTSQTIQEQFEDSTNHETNEQYEEQCPSAEKRKRGKTHMPGMHGRKERKKDVLNEMNQPIGPTEEVVKELGSFLGTLARSATFCPLNEFN